ncbi:MAG: hypothetical protein IT384_29855 [Deltaproteobacteria bacterium]|nr:hypothetical protein [Deltaproteobacteria bacterium]
MADQDDFGLPDLPLRWDDASSGRYEIVRRNRGAEAPVEIARVAVPRAQSGSEIHTSALISQLNDELKQVVSLLDQRVQATEKRLTERDVLMSEMLDQLRAIHQALAAQDRMLRLLVEREMFRAKPPPVPPMSDPPAD